MKCNLGNHFAKMLLVSGANSKNLFQGNYSCNNLVNLQTKIINIKFFLVM